MPRLTPTVKLENLLNNCYNTGDTQGLTQAEIFELQDIYNIVSSARRVSVDTIATRVADTCRKVGFKVEIHGIGWRISK